MRELDAAHLPTRETTYLALGGGLGSFAWVDHLRIYGASTDDVAVIGAEAEPFARYRRLCENSQIGDGERLRSDAASTPDNLWGWPGYGLREMGRSVQQGEWRAAAGAAWQLFSEPLLAESYTPRAVDVYAGLRREAERIGWTQMWRFGRIRAIRQMDDGRYAVLSANERNQP